MMEALASCGRLAGRGTATAGGAMDRRTWFGMGLVVALLAGCASPGGGARPGGAEARSEQAASSQAGGAARGADLAATRPDGQQSARPIERLVLALPAVTGVFIPHVLARDKGFFREEGFEVEFPMMRANAVITALTSGEADYNGMIGPSIPPILSGQPQRVIAGAVVKSTRELMTIPEIRSVEQLRGKAIGVASIG